MTARRDISRGTARSYAAAGDFAVALKDTVADSSIVAGVGVRAAEAAAAAGPEAIVLQGEASVVLRNSIRCALRTKEKQHLKQIEHESAEGKAMAFQNQFPQELNLYQCEPLMEILSIEVDSV